MIFTSLQKHFNSGNMNQCWKQTDRTFCVKKQQGSAVGAEAAHRSDQLL